MAPLLANWEVASSLVVTEGRGFCAVVEGSYSGPRIEDDGLNLEFVKGMLEAFKNQKVIHKRCVPPLRPPHTLGVQRLTESHLLPPPSPDMRSKSSPSPATS